MGATTRPPRYALADLALALSRIVGQIDAVRQTAAQAAAQMIGDGAGVQLLRDDGRYDTLTFHHPDPRQSRLLADALDRLDEGSEDGYSVALRATRRPVLLAPLTPERFTELIRPPHHRPGGDESDLAGADHGLRAAVLCPLIVDNGYAGYLLLVRTTPGGSYLPGDVDLARDVAGELALALSSTRSLERLRVSEERYRRVLECIPEGVLQLDPDGVTTDANEPIGVVLGLPREQVVGLSLRGFLDDPGQRELSRWLTECRAGRATVGGARLVRADGSTRSVRISMTPLPDKHGYPAGSLCMVTDTTDHIDARGLKRQLDHLRRLDSLGQLIGGISHDFNNLLSVVAGSADLLAAGSEPGTGQHQLATDIARAAEKGRTLAHQLLAFGRGGGSRPQIIPIPDLINDIQTLFSRTLGEHVGLEFTFDPDVWPVRADRGPLEQALVNLAANARDAMPGGGVLRMAATNVVVEPGQLADSGLAGRLVHIVLADTGSGMDHQTQLRAFEPFFTTKRTAAGLGLATAAGIFRGIGGHIALESQPRMGTTVHLYIPAAEEADASATGQPPAPCVVGNILVVEDQPELARTVQRLLEPAGYVVTVATDPPSAVAQVAAGTQPDLLITDVVMPGMTGPELAATLRTHHPHLPVLYMSGYTAAALGPQIHLDSNSVLVEKPFTRSTLLSAIRSLSGSPPPSG